MRWILRPISANFIVRLMGNYCQYRFVYTSRVKTLIRVSEKQSCSTRKRKQRALSDAGDIDRLRQGQVGAALAAVPSSVFFSVFF